MDRTMTDLATVAAALGLQVQGSNVAFSRVTHDSRDVRAGDLYVALKGERFDGHDFVAEAIGRGAAAGLVAAHRAPGLAGNLLVASDPLAALGRLATWWRERFTLPLVAVVGSNGKTTVKEMVASIFRVAAGEDAMLATRGNFNNHIGLPLTLLRLRSSHRLGVVELGMNHRGETAALAAIARPTIGLINNAQREHQEFMHSVAEVAEEHAGVIDALPVDGAAIINADDPFASFWRLRAGARAVGDFGFAAAARVNGRAHYGALESSVELATPEGSARFTLHAPGEHNVRNALAAAATARAAGVALDAIAAGLGAFRPVAGRLVSRMLADGATLIDDSYNANPDSVRAAIDVLAALPGRKVLVLGDMGEVGDQGPAFHREVGRVARERGIDALYAIGELSRESVQAFGADGRHFDDLEALVAAVRASLDGATAVLVKGSRFMAMERVVAALQGAGREKE